jgi:dipeptidyl aminopeptidase/acylaminoacyl peptidase
VNWQALLDVVHPTRPAFSADGALIACAVEAAYTLPGAAAQSRIWIAAADGSGAREATRGPGADTAPVWSPDGRSLAFLSDRDHAGQRAVYLLDGGVGEARRVGEVPGSVEQVRFARDGQTLMALAADPGSDRAGADSATRIGAGEADDPRVERAAQFWRRLHRIDTATGETTGVALDGINVWEFDWRGGLLAAIVSDDPAESGWYAARVALVDVDRGVVRDLHDPAYQVEGVSLSPDEARVAFVEGFCSDRGLLVGEAMVVATSSGSAEAPAPELDVGCLVWRDDRSLWFAGQGGLGSNCGAIDVERGGTVLWEGDVSIMSGWTPFLAAAPNGQLLAAASSAWDGPPELCVLDPSAPTQGWRPVTTLNPQAEPPPAACERRTWRSDEYEIEGLLLRPADSDGGRLPLIVWVHGGPTGAFGFEHPRVHHASLLAAGYALLLPNPRGSSGRGQPFARANLGDMGGGDLRDILAGVDAMVAEGVADPDRVGIAGGSYGGFMAAWAVTQSNRFRASIPFAAVTDWLSFHNTTNIGRFDELFLDADPYEAGGEYFHRSPVAHARAVTAPTLVMHGELDLCVPVSQGIEFHRALAEAGVETELVIYPREGHGWREREHQLDGCRRVAEWFDRHLRG